MRKLLLIIAIILVASWAHNKSKTNKEINRPIDTSKFIDENEALAFGALHSMIEVAQVDDQKPDEVAECKCTNGKVSYDGGRSWTDCPCKLNGTCKCAQQQTQVAASVSKDYLLSQYYIGKVTASWCGPCKDWNVNIKPEFDKAGINIEEIDYDTAKSIVDTAQVSEIPSFIVFSKPDKLFHLKQDDTTYMYSGSDFSVEKALELMEELDKTLHPRRNEGLFYVRQQEGQSKLNNKAWASAAEYVTYLKLSNDIPKDWPLDKLSSYELKSIFDDYLFKKLGAINAN